MAHVHCMLDTSGYKYSDYIILTAFPLRQWLQECASLSYINITVLSTGDGQNNGICVGCTERTLVVSSVIPLFVQAV